MKIFFGLPTSSGSDRKIAPGLEALGIKLFKASPSQINIRGLYTAYQPGYEDYLGHLPAFIQATNSGTNVFLGELGYPISTEPKNLLPLSYPNVFIQPRDDKTVQPFLGEFGGKKLSTSSVKGYTICYRSGLYSRLITIPHSPNAYAPAGTVGVDDLKWLIQIDRVISGFLRTHSYPAFQSAESGVDYLSAHAGEKHQLDIDQTTDDKAGKLLKVTWKDGSFGMWPAEKTYKTDKPLRHTLIKAKPNSNTLASWYGPVGDIPYNNGIAFPYLPELAHWDKDTVPNLLDRYFLRSLGRNTDTILHNASELTQAWKNSIHRTEVGNCLSHLAKCLLIALPSRAHVFPVFLDGYRGCVISGHYWKTAIGRDLYEPSPLTRDDLDAFGSNEVILTKIAMLCEVTDAMKQAAFVKMSGQGMRFLNAEIEETLLDVSKIGEIRSLAAQLKYDQEFWKVNCDSLMLLAKGVRSGDFPSEDIPMHSSGLMRTNPLESYLAAFGAICPSPEVATGGIKIDITTGKLPENFSAPLVLKQTSLEVASTEWMAALDKGFILNGPRNLSTRFQHVPLRGNSEREGFLSIMMDLFKWRRDEKRKGIVESNVNAVPGLSVLIDADNLTGF